MHHIERIANPTRATLAAIEGVLETARAGSGRDPLGEAKRSQLGPGTAGWVGLLARHDGVAVGYAHVRWPGGRDPVAAAEVVVDPDAGDVRGIGMRLLDEVRRVVAEQGGGRLHVWAHHVDDPATTLPAAAGFSVARALAVMERELADDPPVAPTPPPGVSLRAYRPRTDDAALLAVNNAAFAGHPEQGGWDAGTLAERTARSWFDPEGVILAWRGDTLLGFHWTKIHPGPQPVGEVYVLGVAPGAQGLGLGRVLLDAGLRWLHERGCRRAVLYVDKANEPAFRLYASAGFEVAHLEVCYAEVVRAVD